MFLEDKLEQAYSQGDRAVKKVMVARIDEIPTSQGLRNYANGIKQINTIWISFCKKHPELDEKWFENSVRKMKSFKQLNEYLRWKN